MQPFLRCIPMSCCSPHWYIFKNSFISLICDRECPTPASMAVTRLFCPAAGLSAQPQSRHATIASCWACMISERSLHAEESQTGIPPNNCQLLLPTVSPSLPSSVLPVQCVIHAACLLQAAQSGRCGRPRMVAFSAPSPSSRLNSFLMILYSECQ